ncbi:hypothetical protein LOTGIDRAFT_236563 [Lottia gigantea]|uniref:Phosphodiesterase n=1 Tax=Lottia gigantea TaxID=225164 RepID=V4B518_LOTGI|nr:hypothetical protein LOTGIDRAFT_236563 [Lottia gigantea]ESO83549.1 hypothetical protein LOTGIDRAFT_236563 [Lottia gigantea]
MAEEWFDQNPDAFQEYVLKKADLALINRWLVNHGFHTLQEYISGRLGYNSNEGSTPSSPIISDGGFFDSKHHRSNSKKHLRQDFARSKMRNMFRTYEPSSSPELGVDARRSSLKEMRQFRSLPPNSVNMLSMLIQSRIRLPRYPSKDIDSKKELRYTNEKEFFLEIVKDISNDLDLRSLSTKIVANMCVLVDADKASVFLVEGRNTPKPSLVSKIFDVHAGSDMLPSLTGDGSMRMAWGKGIIGQVAETGEIVNLDGNACKDPRYNEEIIGYQAEDLLCMPIKNADDEIIGVAQVLNKTGSEDGFDKEDEKALLEVVHDVFEEQTSFENVILRIMQRAQTLLKCERCSVLLRDESHETKFNKVFDLAYPTKNGHNNMNPDNCTDLQIGNKIAELVLITEETINIADAQKDARFDPETDKLLGFHTKTILCKPIRNRELKTIGVAQIVNRIDGQPFDEHDENLFEAFTIFCGLGIHNSLLYEEVSVAAAKQAVALETLSYHASVPNDDVLNIKCKQVPEATTWKLNRFDFNDFSLQGDEMILAAIRMFKDLGLIRKFRIDYEVLCRWLLTVRKNYRNVSYHNWRHAFNVCQIMFTSMMNCETRKHISDKEVLALTVACLCHDLDHRGTNNAFQQKSSSPLAQLYGTKATLEHHHFNHAIIILNSEGHNIFSNFSSDDYSEVINLLKHAILATDLSLHIQIREKFFSMVDAGVRSLDDRECKEIYRSIIMTTCDIAAITKPWEIQRKAADLVVAEFFDQGDKEKNELNLQPMACMDREKQDEIAKLQMSWIDGICLPLYKNLSKMDPNFKPMLEGVLANRDRWEILDAERLTKLAVLETGV